MIGQQMTFEGFFPPKPEGAWHCLVACEESQTVTTELRKLGHIAWSCDLQKCSGKHPEWHIQGDCLPLLNGNCIFVTEDGRTHKQTGKWDLIIAHPPCTHLAISGASWFERKRNDGSQRKGVEFFCKFFDIDCDRVAIENPVGIISGEYITQWFPDLAIKYGLPREPTQTIQPWEFGDEYYKTTCLWLKGLDRLIGFVEVPPPMEYVEWTDKKTGEKKRQLKWYLDSLELPPDERSRVRSKTFPGVARAMARQWTE